MSDRHGLIRTKQCRYCATDLDVGINWSPSHARTSQYLCKACYRIKNARRMSVDHHYIPFKHPLHKGGNYKSFGECAFQNLVKKERAMEGYVYLIVNPAYPDWVKVGCAIDAEDRCSSYQTSSPFRDYELIDQVFVEDRYEAERDLLTLFASLSDERSGEWFRIPEFAALDAFEYWKEEVCI